MISHHSKWEKNIWDNLDERPRFILPCDIKHEMIHSCRSYLLWRGSVLVFLWYWEKGIVDAVNNLTHWKKKKNLRWLGLSHSFTSWFWPKTHIQFPLLAGIDSIPAAFHSIQKQAQFTNPLINRVKQNILLTREPIIKELLIIHFTMLDNHTTYPCFPINQLMLQCWPSLTVTRYRP